MISDYFGLAFKNLKHRGIRSWLTLIGILIGVAAVVSLIGLGNGLKAAVNSQFGVSATELISVSAGGIDMGMPGSGAVNPLTVDDLEVVSKVNNVELAIRRNFETVKVEPKSKTSSGVTAIYYASAMSIPKEDRDFFNEILDLEMYSGSFLDKSDTGKILIGYERSLGNNYLRDTKVGDKLIINDRQFTVKGILEKKGSFTLDYSILMNEDDLNDLADFGEEIDTIQVKMKDKDLMDKTKSDIESALRKSRNVKVSEEDFTVSTPASEQKTVNSVLNGIQIFIIIIASVSVFIGAVGIINTMTTSVLERRREIGIMKSIGARNSNIFYQFFVEAGLLGLVGGIVGATIGTLMSFLGILAINAYLGAELVPSIDFILISASLAGSFFIGAIAGIIPAMNAAKQNPVDALRG